MTSNSNVTAAHVSRWARLKEMLVPVGTSIAWLRTTSWWALPMAGLLLVAALLKGYYVATHDPLVVTWRENRWIQLAIVVYEMVLAYFLVSGWYAPVARVVGLLTFLVYLEVALYEALIEFRPTCSCFGRLNISPWWAAVADGISVLVLDRWRPQYHAWKKQHWLRLAVVGIAALLTIAPTVKAILDYAPRGIVAELRQDKRLDVYVDLVKRGATGKDVVETVQKATGITLSWDRRLPVETVDMGYMQIRKGRAWSLMELLANKIPEPARWRQVNEGYYLAPASRFASKEPFFYIGAVALLAGIGLCIWPVRPGEAHASSTTALTAPGSAR